MSPLRSNPGHPCCRSARQAASSSRAGGAEEIVESALARLVVLHSKLHHEVASFLRLLSSTVHSVCSSEGSEPTDELRGWPRLLGNNCSAAWGVREACADAVRLSAIAKASGWGIAFGDRSSIRFGSRSNGRAELLGRRFGPLVNSRLPSNLSRPAKRCPAARGRLCARCRKGIYRLTRTVGRYSCSISMPRGVTPELRTETNLSRFRSRRCSKPSSVIPVSFK